MAMTSGTGICNRARRRRQVTQHGSQGRRAFVAALVVLALGACSSSSKAASSTTTPSTAASTSPGSGTSHPTVAIATTKLGRVLVNSQGLTLYLYDKDIKPGISACTDVCAASLASARRHGNADLRHRPDFVDVQHHHPYRRLSPARRQRQTAVSILLRHRPRRHPGSRPGRLLRSRSQRHEDQRLTTPRAQGVPVRQDHDVGSSAVAQGGSDRVGGPPVGSTDLDLATHPGRSMAGHGALELVGAGPKGDGAGGASDRRWSSGTEMFPRS